jgi:NAD(P)-dependent dehydrogenase (short-subunit alcohol dehydrogenase family)
LSIGVQVFHAEKQTPLRHIAGAADQAKVVCFLASSDADFVTGVTINVTGGNWTPRITLF